VVVDNRAQSVASNFGLTFFPFTVFVDANGAVLGRLTGAIPIEDILSIADEVFR
jgi:thioredoxin-related protein